MATGHYSCSSNRARVTDARAVRAVLADYNTHNQCSFDGERIGFESPSDTLNVSRDGEGAQVAFLTELAPYLAEELRITNNAEPPYGENHSFTFVVSPDGNLRRTDEDGSEEVLVPA